MQNHDQFADHRLDQEIHAILDAFQQRRDIARHTERLKRLGASAVAPLLRHFADTDRARRTLIFYSLQFCWKSTAIETIAPFLGSDDPELRRMAAIVLVKGEGYERFSDLCRPWLTDTRPEVVAFALDHIESENPDMARTQTLLQQPALHPVLARHLPRYQAPILADSVSALADSSRSFSDPTLAAAGLAALIHINDDRPQTRSIATHHLRHAAPEVRSMAAEYLTWHGTAEESEFLRESRHCERDPWAIAAIETAEIAISRRQESPPRPPFSESLAASDSISRKFANEDALSSAYGSAQHALNSADGTDFFASWRDAWMLYRCAEPMEPHWAYRGREPQSSFIAAREFRLQLQARLFAIPGREAPYESREDCTIPQADRLMAPTRDFYENPGNFGREVEESAVEGFNGLVHIGVDVAWEHPHADVVAIGAGRVRLVSCVATWGTMIIIEHRIAERSWGSPMAFCSLYAHLSPFVAVRAGEVVKCGQKIGSVGRAHT
ncbi:Peptidase_M23 domain-containing protein [Azospirillaceae bacterium]